MSEFSVRLLRTMTGEVGDEIDGVKLDEWTIPLNKIESFSFQMTLEESERIPWNWRFPWMAGAVLIFKRDNEDGSVTEIPWIAGPFIEKPEVNIETGHMVFQVRGIREILKHRYVFDANYRDNEIDAMKRSVLDFNGFSLGTIAEGVVRAAMDKPNGYLPIRFDPSLFQYEPKDDTHRRTYEGFNISNNEADKRLTELTEVINGPDMMFEPRWKDDNHNFIEWWFIHGTEEDPTMPQTEVLSWDTTSLEGAALTDIDLHVSTAAMCNRVFTTGDGQGDGTVIAMRESLDFAAKNEMPILERVEAFSSVVRETTLVTHALEILRTGQSVQINLGIDLTQPLARPGKWKCGDQAKITVGEGWVNLDPGDYTGRLITVRGSDSGGTVLEMEIEDA